MKKILSTFGVLSIALFICSCAPDEKGKKGCDIIGSWKVAEVNIESENLPASLVESMESSYQNSTYNFKEGGAMSIAYSANQEFGFSYTHDETAKTITYKSPESEIRDVFKVQFCSADSLKVTQRLPADETKELKSTTSLTLVAAE